MCHNIVNSLWIYGEGLIAIAVDLESLMHRNDGTNHIHDFATKQVYASFFTNPLAMCWHKKLLSMSWHSTIIQ